MLAELSAVVILVVYRNKVCADRQTDRKIRTRINEASVRHTARLGYKLGVCGYTRTRGFTRTRPAPADRVRIGYAFHGSGRVRVRASRVRVYPVVPVPT